MSLVAIDGPAGAGKTTLAQKFFQEFSIDKQVTLIHMDELYDGWSNALSNRLTQQLEIIIDAHLKHEAFHLEIFNWIIMKFDELRLYEPAEILILEGVGAAQEIVRSAGAETYWLDVEPSIGLERVLKRDGFHIEGEMRKWQIEQVKYFESDLTRNNADHIMTS